MTVEQRPAPAMARLWHTPRHGDLTDAWSAVIATAPDLAGAACKGSVDWDWDPREAGEASEARDARLAAAARTCASCPVLQQCRAYRDGLDERARPAGVMAGEVIPPPGKPTGCRRRAPVAATVPSSAPARTNHMPENRTPATAAYSPDNHQEKSA